MKPWLETWDSVPDCSTTIISKTSTDVCVIGSAYNKSTSLFIAAAPNMLRALLAVEWAAISIGACESCPICNQWREGTAAWASRNKEALAPQTHDAGCILDAALTKAGLVTQEQRDAAREEIEKSRPL